MKLIFIATAVTENGDTVQENAYEDAETALAQAVKMCEDISKHMGIKVMPDAVPLDLYERGDKIEIPLSSE